MTLDQVPTEERTPPLNLAQVLLETGGGGVFLSFFYVISIIDFDLDLLGRDGVHLQIKDSSY